MKALVGLDASALLPGFKEHSARGIGRYVSELAKRLKSPSSDPLGVETFSHEEVLRGSIAAGLVDFLPCGRITARQQLLYPLKLGQGTVARFNLLHFPAHMDPPVWCPRPYIVTVLDLIPLIMKDLYRPAVPGWRFDLARWLELKAITRASLILAISENTSRDVQRLLGISQERIVVTPLGVDSGFFSASCSGDEEAALRRRLGIHEEAEIVLYVGGIDQRKNIAFMLESFRGLLDKMSPHEERPIVLVMAGRVEQDRQYPSLLESIKRLSLSSRVHLTGYLPDEDLLKLYATSRVFFFPSLYEGFGLPALEAMAAGLPVVSSGASSMLEITGDAALLIDPRSLSEAVEALYSVLNDRALAQRLSAEGRARARLFTWEKTAELTLAAYHRLSREMGLL